MNKHASEFRAAQILVKLLKVKAARTMLAFFSQKLEDTATIIPALKAIHSLAELPSFSSEDAVTACEA
jgi:DNA repair/transcription protein MET18/MMS19